LATDGDALENSPAPEAGLTIKKAVLWKLVYLGLVTGILWGALRDWGYDDPFITFRYARNLAQGIGFVYNPGERILSTTTPLFTLVLAATAPIWRWGLDIPAIANLIGAFCLGVGGLLLWELLTVKKVVGTDGEALNPSVPGWAGLLLYPLFPLLLSTLGSEMPLYLALCLGTLVAYIHERYSLAAICVGLAVLTRPDGLLMVGILALDLIFIQPTKEILKTRKQRRDLWTAFFLFLAIVGSWALFAWYYFGSPIPVTLFAKQHQGAMLISQRFFPGFFHMLSGYTRYPYAWVEAGLAGLGIVACVKSGFRERLLLAWTLLYFMAYSFLGVSRYHWYYAPLIPAWIVLVGRGAGKIIKDAKNAKWEDAKRGSSKTVLLSRAMVVGGLVVLGLFQAATVGLLPGGNRQSDPRLAVYRAVGEWLRANVPENARVGALEVGIMGYYALPVQHTGPTTAGLGTRRSSSMVDFAGLLQPAVAAQLGRNSTYTDTANWAVNHYHPDYLALNSGVFRELEKGYVAQNCTPVRSFSSPAGGDNLQIDVYQCANPAQ
jgi:hypothetical protein